MNPETIDNEFAQLRNQADQVAQAIQTFAAKLQSAANSGDANARDYLMDLKSIGLQVQGEQLQMQSLLQAVHDFTVNQLSNQASQQPLYAPQPRYNVLQGGSGGMFGRFLGGGFGRAIMTGAGFGIGDDIINNIL